MDEVDLHKEIHAGSKAKAVLENEAFKAAVAKIQQKILDSFAATDPMNLEALQARRFELKALADICRELKSVMDSGLMATEQVETLRQRALRMIRGKNG